jgi:hypothetical protein
VGDIELANNEIIKDEEEHFDGHMQNQIAALDSKDDDILDIEIGYRHHDIYCRFPGELSNKMSDQGFYTSFGRFVSRKEAKGFSPIAEALFDFPFVKNVFIAANFITITKTDNVPWDFITMELREFIKEWIAAGKDVLIQMPQPKVTENELAGEKIEFPIPPDFRDLNIIY